MRKILLVAATEQEISPLLDFLRIHPVNDREHIVGNVSVTVVITGVGMVATSHHCAVRLTGGKYDLAINLGIAGAFNRDIRLGEVVNITKDEFPEMGAQDGLDFLSLADLTLIEPDEYPYHNNVLSAIIPDFIGIPYREVNGITVNTVHGETAAIEKMIKNYNPDIESMEGAAFFYSCLMEKTPCIQLRAISNYVERRNREAWKIAEAIGNVNAAAIELLKKLA